MKLAFVSLDRNMSLPLGIASILAYLEEKLNFNDYQVIDANFDDVLVDTLRYKPDLVAISALSLSYGEAIRLATALKNKLDVPIIMGGVHISTLPTSLKPCFDVGVIGEGEQTMLELIKLFEKERGFDKSKLKKIDGLIFFDEHRKLVYTNLRAIAPNLDDFPIPKRDAFSREYYKRKFDVLSFSKVSEGALYTSRGCPYKCQFCSATNFWSKIRFNSAQRVADEIKQLIEKFKVDYIVYDDDLFTMNLPRMKELRILLKKEGLLDKISAYCQGRTNLMNDELCTVLKNFNIKVIGFGFESGNERMLQYLKGKSITLEHHKKAIQLCNKYGIKSEGTLIMGSPTETLSEMEDTLKFIDYCIKNNVSLIRTYITTPFPSTPFWEIAKERGKVSDDMDWDEFAKHDVIANYSIEHPLLLDPEIPLEDFKKVFLKGRKKLIHYRWKFWMASLRGDPMGLMNIIFHNPLGAVKKILNPSRVID